MDIKQILNLPFHKMTQKENLKVLVESYKNDLGKDVCVTCRGSLNEMILNLKRHNNMSNFEIKGNKHFRLSGRSSKVINNNIITDELAVEFLKIDPSRIRLFDKYPDNWEEMVQEGVENEPFEDTPEEAEMRKELSEKKLPELRTMYPDIKQVSKDDFITDILRDRRKNS